MTIAYDGFDYSGWQIQPGKRTVQGEIVEAVSNLFGKRTHVHGASRTDAGVSALGQVGLFETDSPIPVENLAKAITGKLPADIAVLEAVEEAWGFDLMSSVTSKLYRYTIFTGRTRPVLDIRHCWHLPVQLDVAAMSEAAKLLVGKKDFKSFASSADKRQSSVRTIFRCDVRSSCVVRDASCEQVRQGSTPDTAQTQYNTQYDWIYVDVEGDGFLYNMVRNIVGTLVDIGTSRWQPEKINEILEAKDRTAAGQLAPPQGLCLMWIKY
ncbi:MAG: tRNA pseudouridine(38-40) synthase TruA [Phycisphaerales bacterium]|nr:MAG: tRNA pseudouridine(38-40) synthase TruA [Phycisphaerales bacterium]